MPHNDFGFGWPYDAPVVVARADSYDPGEIAAAVAAVVGAAGGLSAFIPPGRAVLVKPNLMSAREPARAVTTHPAVTAAVAAGARAAGYAVAVGDSPAGAFKGLARVWGNTGTRAVCDQGGFPLISFEAGGSVVRPVESKFVTEIRVAAACSEAAVVSIPKLKTHFLTLFTGAVKNLLGQVPGLAKAQFHRLAPHPDDFATLLVDLLPAYPPAFTIMDAVVGLEGDGPAGGAARRFNLIVGGANAAAVDVVAAGVLGFAPGETPTVRSTIERGMTPARPEVVYLRGASAQDLVNADVLPPGSRWLRRVPRPVLKLAGRQFVVYPEVTPSKCDGCGRCAASCPTGAATMRGDVAFINVKKCIQCLCCFETCADEAITLRPRGLAKLYYDLRDARRRRRVADAARTSEPR